MQIVENQCVLILNEYALWRLFLIRTLRCGEIVIESPEMEPLLTHLSEYILHNAVQILMKQSLNKHLLPVDTNKE